MSRYIIGVHAGHNASVCIGDERGILHAVQEERLTGEKNYWGLPVQSVRACLAAVGATPRDVATVAYGGTQVLCRYHSRDDILKAYERQGEALGRLRQRVAMPLVMALMPTYGQGKFRAFLQDAGLGTVPLSFYPHHQTHAATAYYGLRTNHNDRYLVLTCDGSGDNVSSSVTLMGGGEPQLVAQSSVNDSLGTIYSWVTYLMGFVPLEHEYKLMGMAPYASEQAAEKMAKVFHRYLGLGSDGLTFRRKTRRRTNDLSGEIRADMQGERFDVVCAGLQRFTEQILVAWVKNAVAATGVRRVVAAGGVFMNVKANKAIAELPEVESFEAFPSCGDETLPIGTYYLEAAAQFGDAAVKPLSDFYLGDDIDGADAERALRESGYRWDQPADIANAVAELLVAGEPVARCSGRMEFGARALGNRSILADPKNSDVVRVINQMVKKRDFWMPFAPMMMASKQNQYLKNPKGLKSPYMMMTYDTRENFRDLIAAVHNADLTCRAQLVPEGQNPDMERILGAFEARTGRAVVLNTSFNLHGFPIVRTAGDALHVFKNSGLQHMQVGRYLVHKA